MPIGDSYRLSSDFKGYYSDGYVTDVNAFTKDVKYDKHGDMNISVGFGDMDDTWELSVFARNILQARQTYNPEFDVAPDGFLAGNFSPNNFMTYGVNLHYNFR